MLTVLIHNLQNAIVSYVIDKEQAHYRGNFRYDIAYIRQSRALSKARIGELVKFDALLQRAKHEGLSPVELVTEVRCFIESLTTGFRFIFRFSTGSSVLKTSLTLALCISEPSLKAWFIKNPDVNALPRFEKALPGLSQSADVITLADHLALERRYEDLKHEFDETRQTVLRMQTIINRLVKEHHSVASNTIPQHVNDEEQQPSSRQRSLA